MSQTNPSGDDLTISRHEQLKESMKQLMSNFDSPAADDPIAADLLTRRPVVGGGVHLPGSIHYKRYQELLLRKAAEESNNLNEPENHQKQGPQIKSPRPIRAESAKAAVLTLNIPACPSPTYTTHSTHAQVTPVTVMSLPEQEIVKLCAAVKLEPLRDNKNALIIQDDICATVCSQNHIVKVYIRDLMTKKANCVTCNLTDKYDILMRDTLSKVYHLAFIYNPEQDCFISIDKKMSVGWKAGRKNSRSDSSYDAKSKDIKMHTIRIDRTMCAKSLSYELTTAAHSCRLLFPNLLKPRAKTSPLPVTEVFYNMKPRSGLVSVKSDEICLESCRPMASTSKFGNDKF